MFNRLSFSGCIFPRGALVIAPPPPCSPAEPSHRGRNQAPRHRKLSREQVEAIREDAGDRTLRDLAAAFGVSHETIRAVLRQRGAERFGESVRGSPLRLPASPSALSELPRVIVS